MGRRVDLKGMHFGRWEVLNETSERDKTGAIRWLCKCSCGTVKTVNGTQLRNGASTSCGCYNREIITKENPKYKTKLYGVWHSLKDRCSNPNNKSYHNYGGRGIKFHKEWETFEAFESWAFGNGYKQGLWLERKDNNKGYYPENCCFTTPKEQQNNKRTNVMLTIGNTTKTLTMWAEQSGLKAATIKRRMELGWTEENLLKPIIEKYSHSEQIKCAIQTRKEC